MRKDVLLTSTYRLISLILPVLVNMIPHASVSGAWYWVKHMSKYLYRAAFFLSVRIIQAPRKWKRISSLHLVSFIYFIFHGNFFTRIKRILYFCVSNIFVSIFKFFNQFFYYAYFSLEHLTVTNIIRAIVTLDAYIALSQDRIVGPVCI